MSSIVAFSFQFADAFTFLVLASVGLAVIFGMMGIVNLAHGEFIMCGAYVTVSARHAGLPLPCCIALSAAATAAIGMLVERLLVRHLYARPADSIVATWGLSLLATQATLILFGPTTNGLASPFGALQIAGASISLYRCVLLAVAIAVVAGLYLLFMHTGFGLNARATMQNAAIARTMGIDADRVYCLTFGLGAGLAGMTGALYAPTMIVIPTMGAGFIVQAFITVVVGGSNVLIGAAPAAGLLSLLQTLLTTTMGQTIGQLGLLCVVIVAIRLLPQGISGLARRRGSHA